MERKYITNKFESVAGFLGYLSAGETQPVFVGHTRSMREGERSWYGTDSLDEATRLFKGGDTVTKKKIEDAAGGAAKLMSFGDVKQATRIKAVSGYKVSIGAYLSGSPKCFVKRAQVARQSKAATVIIGLTYNYHVTTQEMIYACANMAKAIIKTEREKGIKFNVYVAYCTTEGLKKNSTCAGSFIKVKSSSQLFNLNMMAYSLANPSMLRRHFFRWIEITEGIPCGFSRGYGFPVSDKEIVKSLATSAGIKADYILNGDNLLGKSSDQIQEYIINQQ